MFFSCIYVCWIPREVLKTSTFNLGFQHFPLDPANVNARKNMFEPCNDSKFLDRQVWANSVDPDQTAPSD